MSSPDSVSIYNNTFDAVVAYNESNILIYGDDVVIDGSFDAGYNKPIILLKAKSSTATLPVTGGLFTLSIPQRLNAGVYSLTLTETDANNNTYNITYLKIFQQWKSRILINSA